MLYKVVLSITFVITVIHIALPPLKLAMAFILMSHPIGLAFERFRLSTGIKGASERLDVFMNVLRPIGWFMEFLDFEA